MIVALLTQQIIIMFALMMIGFAFYKIGYISNQGSKDMAKILLYLVIPVVVIKNFQIEFNSENVSNLLYSLVIATICMAIAMAISFVIFRKDGISNFSSSFSNAAFIGIPLVSAAVGSHAAFYISMMIVLVNFLQWTYGVFVITKDPSSMSIKKIVTNPIVISVVVGALLFVLQIKLPPIVTNIFNTITNLNTPLAMITSGVYLAQTDILKMIKKPNNYLVSASRLVIIPLVSLLVLKFIPFGSVELKLAILIAAACPVGSNVAIFAQTYNQDYRNAVEQVCLSTLLCLLTLPLLISVASMLF